MVPHRLASGRQRTNNGKSLFRKLHRDFNHISVRTFILPGAPKLEIKVMAWTDGRGRLGAG